MSAANYIGLWALPLRHLDGGQRLLHSLFVKSAAGDGEAAPSPGYEALSSGCAVVGPSPEWRPSWLELSGVDRVRFLHGLVTCDVKALVVGQGTYGFFVDAKGKILADVVVSAREERLLLELPENKAAELRAHLERFVVADQVDVKEVGGTRSFVVGPGADTLLQSLLFDDSVSNDSQAPKGWDARAIELVGESFLLRGERRLGVGAWIVRSDTETAMAAFLDTAATAGAVVASMADLETIRIEQGMPRAGVDFGEDHFPQETGLEEQAVSYTKGCYLGQEVVARIHYRGKVNHALRGVVADKGDSLPSGSLLEDDEGNDAGRVTSGTFSRAQGHWIGLAILHRRVAKAGRRLNLASRGSVAVVELPFAGRA
ncbi:MAG: hypothetical protein OES47_02375 [Acidobacteriota bacterium]|nr:hypothetical protein [Acidobacteriota bacterium]